MLEAFDKYVSNYDLNDEKIKLKYNHSIRVMEQMVKYAKLLGFSEEDVLDFENAVRSLYFIDNKYFQFLYNYFHLLNSISNILVFQHNLF